MALTSQQGVFNCDDLRRMIFSYIYPIKIRKGAVLYVEETTIVHKYLESKEVVLNRITYHLCDSSLRKVLVVELKTELDNNNCNCSHCLYVSYPHTLKYRGEYHE